MQLPQNAQHPAQPALTHTYTPTHDCPQCGDEIDPRRAALGYRLCLWCGEEQAKQERRLWTIAPMHKSNYMLLTNREDLLGINSKGGLYR